MSIEHYRSRIVIERLTDDGFREVREGTTIGHYSDLDEACGRAEWFNSLVVSEVFRDEKRSAEERLTGVEHRIADIYHDVGQWESWMTTLSKQLKARMKKIEDAYVLMEEEIQDL